jgi:hypothetical protein
VATVGTNKTYFGFKINKDSCQIKVLYSFWKCTFYQNIKSWSVAAQNNNLISNWEGFYFQNMILIDAHEMNSKPV